MTWQSNYDAWATGGRYSKFPVRVVCTDCGEEWDGDSVSEYGAGWLEPHEDCPKCGSTNLDTEELDALDISERRAEASGRGDEI